MRALFSFNGKFHRFEGGKFLKGQKIAQIMLLIIIIY